MINNSNNNINGNTNLSSVSNAPSDGVLRYRPPTAGTGTGAGAGATLRTTASNSVSISHSSSAAALSYSRSSGSHGNSSALARVGGTALRWGLRLAAVAAVYAATLYFLQDALIYMRRGYGGADASYYSRVRARGVPLPPLPSKQPSGGVSPSVPARSAVHSASVSVVMHSGAPWAAAESAAHTLAAADPRFEPMFPKVKPLTAVHSQFKSGATSVLVSALPLLPVPSLSSAARAAVAAAGAAAPAPSAAALARAGVFWVVPPPPAAESSAMTENAPAGTAKSATATKTATVSSETVTVGASWNPLQGDVLPADFYTEPHAVVVLFGGNAQTALDWPFFIQGIYAARAFNLNQNDKDAAGAEGKPARLAFVVVDYPGYGLSPGSPSPSTVLASARDSIETFLLLTNAAGAATSGASANASASSKTQTHPHTQMQTQTQSRSVNVVVAGHSLGCAAALLLAESLLANPLTLTAPSPFGGVASSVNGAAAPSVRVGGALLLSPFSSMLAMARAVVGPIPLLGLLLRHNWDNERALASIDKLHSVSITSNNNDNIDINRDKSSGKLPVSVFHGVADEIVPVLQARALTAPYLLQQQQKATVSGAGATVSAGMTVGSGVSVSYREVPRAGHNNLIEAAARDVAEEFERVVRAAASASAAVTVAATAEGK